MRSSRTLQKHRRKDLLTALQGQGCRLLGSMTNDPFEGPWTQPEALT